MSLEVRNYLYLKFTLPKMLIYSTENSWMRAYDLVLLSFSMVGTSQNVDSRIILVQTSYRRSIGS